MITQMLGKQFQRISFLLRKIPRFLRRNFYFKIFRSIFQVNIWHQKKQLKLPAPPRPPPRVAFLKPLRWSSFIKWLISRRIFEKTEQSIRKITQQRNGGKQLRNKFLHFQLRKTCYNFSAASPHHRRTPTAVRTFSTRAIRSF